MSRLIFHTARRSGRYLRLRAWVASHAWVGVSVGRTHVAIGLLFVSCRLDWLPAPDPFWWEGRVYLGAAGVYSFHISGAGNVAPDSQNAVGRFEVVERVTGVQWSTGSYYAGNGS